MAFLSMVAALVVVLIAAVQIPSVACEQQNCSAEDGDWTSMLQLNREILKSSAAEKLGALVDAEEPGRTAANVVAFFESGVDVAASAVDDISANATIFMNGTAASKAVQRAMETEMADFPPACRKFVQWTLEEPQAGAASSLRLDDVAIGLISGRHDFFGPAHRNILQYAPRGLLIRARGKCPCSFRAALRVLRDEHPAAEWYYVGDEDAMIDLSSLVRLLGQHDPAVPTLISSSSRHDICETCGACPKIRDQHGRAGTTDFYGGTGQIFSRGLVEALAPGLRWACREAEEPTLSGFGDLENTCATASWWQPSWRFVRLNRRRSTWSWFEAQKPNFVVAHHLCPELLERLTHVNHGQTQRHAEPIFADNGANDGCTGPAR